MTLRFTLGTRGSPLALAQANEARRRLAHAMGWDLEAIALKVIRTTGDRIQDRALMDAGGKGLFTREIDEALVAGAIDAAVHSAKDLPAVLPEDVALAAFLPREDVRDAFVSSLAETIEGLPSGATFGAASLRRQAQALRLRKDLKPELLRGNVETRLRKAESGAIGATLLAMAGLKRLGLAHRARGALDLESFLPAPGQGAIALTARSADEAARATLEKIAHAPTATELMAERAFLAVLNGSCRTPIAALARCEAGSLRFKGQVLLPDGSQSFEAESAGPASEAQALGRQAGLDLVTRMPDGLPPEGG